MAASFPVTQTDVIPVDPVNPQPSVIGQAAEVIRAGGLVAFPTETVYGLGANALDERAVERIFEAKERAKNDPLIVHIADLRELERVVRDVPAVARALAERFWPGPLTLVLPRRQEVPANVSAGLETVAVRLPRHAVALALIRAAGVPIAAPSANRFTRTSATTAAHVVEDLGGRVEMVLDGGPADVGVESTVVTVDGAKVVVLRPGALPAEELEAAARAAAPGATVEFATRAHRQASPGMMEKHYAPRAELVYLRGSADQTIPRLARAVREAVAEGRRVGVLAPSEDIAEVESPGVDARDLGAAGNLEALAHELYAGLRALDAAGVEVIFARQMGDEGLARALDDRLRRAATKVLEG